MERMPLDLHPLLAYIPMDRRQALAQRRALPDRTSGAALFADISGFTPLTEALVKELGQRRGAEELTRQLNTVYSALIGKVHRYGGSVISFSGDAITCWFNGDEGLLATACALAMQETMRAFAQVKTPGGTAVALAIKVALTTGPVRRFLVGDPQIQTIDVLAGATLDNMAAAEKQAEKGEVVVGPAALAHLRNKIIVAGWREDEAGNRYAVVDGVTTPITLATPWPPIPPTAFTAEMVRPWLLPPVYERLQGGQGQYLAELRPGVTLFMRFTGLDYDGDDNAGQKLDAFMRWVQNVLAHYDGYMLQLTVGDKGSYLYGAFGAPIAHDDDPARAVAAALELRAPPALLSYITGIQIGISQGRLRTGAYGGQTRRTYGVLGDEVNTSARLMGQAKAGQILVSAQVAEAASRSHLFNSLGEMALKGKREPVPVLEALGRRHPTSQRPSTLYTTPLVGREAELAQLGQSLAAALAGKGQVLRLEGPAGIGKSHLAAEFSEQAIRRGFHVVVGTSQSASQSMPYYAWRQVFRVYFKLAEESAPGEDSTLLTARQIEQVTTAVQQTNPDWALRLPLLGDLLGLPIPDNPVTASFDPRLRQEALFTLAVEIVQMWAQARPLLLLIEDGHWLDEASSGLALSLARAIGADPVALVLVQRPPLRADRPLLPELDTLAHYHHLDLGELTPAGVVALIANRLHGQPSALAASLIQAQAQGNPFFTEELVDALREAEQLRPDADGVWTLSEQMAGALRDAGCLVWQNGEWVLAENASLSAADLDIPDSIHGIVLSRIDRLPESHKLTLKVASVIGRTFEVVLLNHTHPAHPPPGVLQEQVGAMEARDFVRLETPPPQLAYMFKHSTTQEVTYDTLLFAQRRALHRTVARWYEQTFGDVWNASGLESPLAPFYPLLVYHWRQAEAVDKERFYAGLAGEQAAAQFANEEAITYFSRALELTPANEWDARYELLLQREAVYGLIGRRESQARDLIELQTLADQRGSDYRRAEVALRFANYYEALSDFNTALMIAQQAVTWAEQAADPRQKVKGLIAWGLALWRRGALAEAQRPLNEALDLARGHEDHAGEATSLHHLGTVLYIFGSHGEARHHLEQALAIRDQLGDLLGKAGSLNNLVAVYHALGDFGRGKNCCEQALHIYRTIGNRREETTTLNNLATLHHTLGDLPTARDYFQKALALCLALDNRQGESLAANNLGLVLHDLGDHVAAAHYSRRALAIARAIGDKVGQGYSLTALALALEGAEAWSAAHEAYQEALQLRRAIGQTALAIDDLAGLARIAMNQGQGDTAVRYSEEILAWIDTHDVFGAEYPLRVYLTCADVLTAVGDYQRAGNILAAADRLVQEQAARISDEATRLAFLERVPLHQQLRARL
jgi:adenylate cyclase